MSQLAHRFVNTNGIRMHIAEQGEGPLVILCHGFPESWYSWRHQIQALADGGYHVVAPDMRGYGRTSRPHAVEAYTQPTLVGDIVGLLQELGEETAVIAGHDWGAPVAWNAALMRPDLFPAVIALSVPYLPRTSIVVDGRPMPPTEMFKLAAGENFLYLLYFQEPGKAERELEADVRRWLRGFFFTASGDMPPEKVRFVGIPKDSLFSASFEFPEEFPSWLTEQDLDYFAGEFERTGFSGGLSWYRCFDLTWEQMAPFTNARVTVPALFIAGDRDGVITGSRAALDALPQTVPNLRASILLEGCGHWTQQERPEEVNRAMLEFLEKL
jgi:pimeloyl-ACP methyl ester carboxylesterase